MKKNFSKGTKSALALAMATVLAVPAVSVLNAANTVSADDTADIPEPIAVYDYKDTDNVTFSAASIENGNQAEILYDTGIGKVVKLNQNTPVVVSQMGVEVATKAAAEFEKDHTVTYTSTFDGEKYTAEGYLVEGTATGGNVTEVKYIGKDGQTLVYNVNAKDTNTQAGIGDGSVVVVTYEAIQIDDNETHNINSSIELDNPFAGKTELVEEPIDYLESSAPIWENGVSFSYWMKTNGLGTEEDTESPIVSFNTEKDEMHKDDKDKNKLAQIYYSSLDENGETTNPLFKAGNIIEVSNDNHPTEYNGKPIKWTKIPGKNSTRYVIQDYGVFAVFNPNYNPDNRALYYWSLSADGESYSMTQVSSSKIDISKYVNKEDEESLIRYGKSQGCLTFLASGGYVFNGSGKVEDVYKGGEIDKTIKDTEKTFQRNQLRAYTYLLSGKDKVWKLAVDENDDEVESLVESSEWHYITYVIKNDSISLYVDGIAQDEAMFTDTSNESTLLVQKSFNKGYGYHCSTNPDSDFVDIQSENGGEKMFRQAGSYLVEGDTGKELEKNIITDLYNNGETGKYLGFNGNTNGETLMEYLTNENTKLYIGEDGPSQAVDIMEAEFGSKADTYVGAVSFYDEPLTSEDVMNIYNAQTKPSGEFGDESEENPTPTPTVSGEPVSPTPTVSGEPVSPTPSQTPEVEKKVGDANLDKAVNLDDVMVILKAALGIEELEEGSQAFINADVNADETVGLDDCLEVLKIAVGIK